MKSKKYSRHKKIKKIIYFINLIKIKKIFSKKIINMKYKYFLKIFAKASMIPFNTELIGFKLMMQKKKFMKKKFYEKNAAFF